MYVSEVVLPRGLALLSLEQKGQGGELHKPRSLELYYRGTADTEPFRCAFCVFGVKIQTLLLLAEDLASSLE